MASELSWSSFSSTMAAEEPDLLAQFLGSYGEQEQEPLFCPDQGIDPNFYYWPIQNNCSFSYCNNMESNMMATVGLRSEPMPPYKEEEIIDQKIHSDCKRKIQVCEGAGADSIHIESSSRKKVRGSWQAGRSSKKSSKSKKADKDAEVGEEEEDGDSFAPTVQSFSCCSSEDEANTSQESNLNSKGKMRAGRGSATDPQSLYARKRRERINERLKILQNLVPNGTKVDISTMLEEAVQYVKFLQVQIKLLSSDELWMFAPIAYNGMNIGIDLII